MASPNDPETPSADVPVPPPPATAAAAATAAPDAAATVPPDADAHLEAPLGPPPDEPPPSTPRSRRLALASVLAVPFVANLVAICGLVHYQPEAKTSGLGLIHKLGVLSGGQPYIDPNVGFNSYAVGHAAALSWLHGHVPWWDLYQGLGTPLAGSIQSASFFPPTLLLALSDGSLWFHLCLELLAGWACYALLRELRCSPFAAAVGAIAFELNGSLAWITNAPANPVPFLPLLALGIEWIVGASRQRRRGGWVLLAVGVWLTIVAGFPEVAVLNAGLAVAWLVVRLIQYHHDALRIALKAALAGASGVLFSAPLLNAFVRNLRLDIVGAHSQPLATLSIPRTGLAQLVAPYVFGGIFDNATSQVGEVWGRVGGYTGTTLLVLAVGALFGRRQRWVRALVAAWAIVFLGYLYNVPVFHQLVEHTPGLLHLAVYRYATGSILFCLCVLAALCLDDLTTITPFQAFVRMLPGLGFVVVIFVIGFFSTTIGRQWSQQYLPKWYWGSIAIFCVTVLVLFFATVVLPLPGHGRWNRLTRVVLGAVLVVEAFGFFEVPILAYPRSVTYDTSVVAYLRANLGTQRYYTIGPASPDFGAYYGIASLDLSDLPVPKRWTTFVHTHLNSCIFPWQFGNGPPEPPGCVPAVYEMIAHAPSYEESGVKYFVMGTKHDLSLFYEPNFSNGPPTPDGAATMVLRLRPPSFFPNATLRGFDLRLVGGAPPGLATEVCARAGCTTATAPAPGGRHFTLAHPLTMAGTLTIFLNASNEHPIQVLTVPASPPYPSTVTADGVLLRSCTPHTTVCVYRSAMVKFTYDPATVPRLVFQSVGSRVYALPDPSPIGTAPGCTVVAHSMTSFTTRCRRASTLTYRELSFPGWRATVRGAPAKITTASNGVYQEIALPAGTSSVDFTYEPPDALLAWIAMAIGGLGILLGFAHRRILRRKAPVTTPEILLRPPLAPDPPVASAAAGPVGPAPPTTD